MKKYDDASWHFEAENFNEKNIIAAYTHIAMFIHWLYDSNLLTDETKKAISIYINNSNVKDFNLLIQELFDGKLTEDMLKSEVKSVLENYYENHYFEDYINTLDINDEFETPYQIPNTVKNYQTMKDFLDTRIKLN